MSEEVDEGVVEEGEQEFAVAAKDLLSAIKLLAEQPYNVVGDLVNALRGSRPIE